MPSWVSPLGPTPGKTEQNLPRWHSWSLQWENIQNIFQGFWLVVLVFFSSDLWSALALFSVRREFEGKKALHNLLDRLLKLFKCKKKNVVGRKTQQSLVSLDGALKRLYPKFTGRLRKS